jgi:hypothetical protein
MMIRLAIPDRTVPYIITVKLHGSLFDVSRSARARTKTEVVHLLLSTSCPSMSSSSRLRSSCSPLHRFFTLFPPCLTLSPLHPVSIVFLFSPLGPSRRVTSMLLLMSRCAVYIPSSGSCSANSVDPEAERLCESKCVYAPVLGAITG